MIQKEGYNVAKLSATSSLGGYDKEIGTIRLREISNQSLIAMAIPLPSLKSLGRLKRAHTKKRP